MCDQQNAITQREINPEWLILDLCGSINSLLKEKFEAVAHHIYAAPTRQVVLNFSGVSQVDGPGLRALLLFCVSLRRMNRKLSCFGMRKEVMTIFRLARLDTLLHIYPDEDRVLLLAGGK